MKHHKHPRPFKAVLGAAFAACLLAGAHPAMAAEPVDCINPLSGTNGNGEFSRGNTVAAIVAPFGMTTWAPETNSNTNPWYQMKDTQFEGMRATHQPSIWIRDYSQFLVMPVVGDWKGTSKSRASGFSHANETARAYYYSAMLDRYQTKVELTPTERCAMMRFTFPAAGETSVVLETEGAIDTAFDPERRKIRGTATHVTFGAPGGFALYFEAEFDRPFDTVDTEHDKKLTTSALHFKNESGKPVLMKIATSFISYDQDGINARRELPDWNFEAARDRAKAAWTRELATVEIKGGTDAQRSTFYTSLYRALQFPRMFFEPDATGKIQHYSPFDGKLHDGPEYTDDGLWDTYRAAFPLLTLYYPKRETDILQGWLNAYREGGGLPTWPSPGNRPCMIGSHGDSIFADAYAKGLRDYNLDDAYAAVRKDGTVQTSGWVGRDHLDNYIEKNYMSTDARKDAATSVTLEYAYDDWCIARMAKALGHEDDAKLFGERARNYRNVWDKETGFMRGKKSDGSWQEPFDPIEWGGAYVEGNAWQWTWSVMQDPYGLMALMGGPDGMGKKLDEMMSMPSTYKPGTYHGTIHEMRETEFAKMGQYAHVNEPCHHVLYFYNYARQPWKTQYWVRRVMDELYNPDGMVGDEDTGQMSAWYVFNAAGFYPFCPGTPNYLLGSPLFEQTTLHLGGGKSFVVRANHNSAENRYIQSAKLNGQPFTKTWLAHQTITAGGTLELEMGREPNKNWGNNEADAPPNEMP